MAHRDAAVSSGGDITQKSQVLYYEASFTAAHWRLYIARRLTCSERRRNGDGVSAAADPTSEERRGTDRTFVGETWRARKRFAYEQIIKSARCSPAAFRRRRRRSAH